MKIVLQRVKKASVSVAGDTIGSIDRGFLLLIGFGREDETGGAGLLAGKMEKAIEKICRLRVFPDTSGKLDHSLLDIGGAVLAVPQFTLYGQTRKGRRPDFVAAMPPRNAEQSFLEMLNRLRNSSIRKVEAGRFGADMKVKLLNDGPFTLLLEY